jgi:ribosomal protein L40E
MTFCTNCGENLPKEANFCPKCGWKAQLGVDSNVHSASDEFRESMTKMSIELEKAFNVAAKEIQKAFQTAKNNIQEATTTNKEPTTTNKEPTTTNKEPMTTNKEPTTTNIEPTICPNCGEKNHPEAIYCSKCGNKLKT